MVKQLYVTKRDGKKEPYSVEKIQRQIEYAVQGIQDVSQSMVEMSMDLELYDGITTEDLDQIAIRAAVNLIKAEHGDTNYQYVAGRLLNSSLRKRVYGQYQPPRLYEIIQRNVNAGMYTPELLEWFSEAEWDQMETFIDHSKDEQLSHSALSQLVDKYLIRNRDTKQMYETPQVRYIVAGAVEFHAEPTKRLDYIRDFYNQASNGLYSLPTPVLAGLGTRTKQFSSCVLIKIDDSLKSIYAGSEAMAFYAAKRAGIGMDFGSLRPAHAPIRGGEAVSSGPVPFVRKFMNDLGCVSQGDIRKSSATMTFPVWHYDFEDLIVLKNNQGTEETRARHLDYSVMTNNYLWNRYIRQEQMTLFNPDEVPDLYRAFYEDDGLFGKLYEEYEKDPKIKFKKTIGADVVFDAFVGERSDTGRIFSANQTNIQNQGPIKTWKHPIYLSNLCHEILIPTVGFESREDERGRIALCTLGSLNWGKIKKPEDLRSAARLLVRGLDNILNYQDFVTVQSKLANDDFRPLGIGVTGLAQWMAQRGFKYGDREALNEISRWMEYQTYYLTEASIELAEERGPCGKWQDTYYADGIFPHERRSKHVDEILDFKTELDWEPLRARVVVSGIRNALLGAIAPVESSSVVIESTSGIDMLTAHITIKESRGGVLVQVAPQYKKLKKNYQILQDQPDPVNFIKTSAAFAIWIDQSISTNTNYSPKWYPGGRVDRTVVTRNLIDGHRWGLKTWYYNITEKQAAKVTTQENQTSVADETEIAYTSGESEACPSCVL
ncbi:ribonucleotide reductase [Stenotrophomonas phage Mendera]|uniref:Ribonucleoside-diphosphate reductase n=1 Tax=Stenotrophomonas phage Mendera TaxID=2650877 RepID=A0A5P8PIV1_9CAUD|nr:ribonucleotide reductase large subunit [Stenotrophomonas phage Mendera]QFR56657.1 ribonucleotide reductase [Stenotrophomonas phage Mendera]